MNPPLETNSRRILVVDDNEAIHADFRKILNPRLATEATLAAMEATLFGDVTDAVEAFHIDSAYQGREGFATGGPTSRISPAPEGGVEADLHALGRPYAFVDFRSSRNDRRSPFRAPQTVRAPKFESVTIADADRIYDGVFFIDQMSPATPA